MVLELTRVSPKTRDREVLNSVCVYDIGNLEYPDLLFLDTREDACELYQFCTRITGSPATVNTPSKARPNVSGSKLRLHRSSC